MTTTSHSLTSRPVILVVDDVAANLIALEAMLRRDDIEIVTVSSGASALEVLLARDVALAIIDVQMPEMDGFALAELMRGVEKTRFVPIIFVTAGARDQSRVFQGYDAGAVDFLFKPIEPHILRGKVEVFATLERQRQQLREQDRMREMFMGILGHDLRNPLSGIIMCAQILHARADDEALREPLARILASGQRMTRMVEQLLDLTRLRLGSGIALTITAVDLGSVVTSVVDESEQTRARCRLETAGEVTGRWDTDRLLQVAANLVGNAMQHGAPGTPIVVRVDGTTADRVTLSVHNQGPPIPDELRPVLFAPFRGLQRDCKSGGLGLGLYITEQLVLAHGGTIAFSSDERSGTCFTVTLPRPERGAS
ncbi:MAG: hybrid sensor histidine kinase/response regulator [Deltaproteobacteria bacterium]|nr:hybrid sensor histidine kinase/response regulator [Deltaproteobacteria bacterium]